MEKSDYQRGYEQGRFDAEMDLLNRTPPWQCGKCDQERIGEGEIIPEHHKTCELSPTHH